MSILENDKKCAAEALELVHALNAMLCHDLAGPIGAIHSYSVLLAENKVIRSDVVSLLADEAKKLVDRIILFRSALGDYDSNHKVTAAYLIELISNSVKDKKINVELKFDKGIDQVESIISKIIICLSSISTRNINYQGEVRINVHNDDSDTLIQLSTKGYDLNLSKEYFALLNGKVNVPINVDNCRENYVRMLCAEIGCKLHVHKDKDLIIYRVSKKGNGDEQIQN